MRFEGLEAFMRVTVAISLYPNCLIKRLVKFGKIDFSTFRGGLCPEPRPVQRGLFTKIDPKTDFFENSRGVVFRANDGC